MIDIRYTPEELRWTLDLAPLERADTLTVLLMIGCMEADADTCWLIEKERRRAYAHIARIFGVDLNIYTKRRDDDGKVDRSRIEISPWPEAPPPAAGSLGAGAG